MITIEEIMESNDIPESDRDEVRTFQEFLQRRKDKRDGKPVAVLSEELKGWLGFEESDNPNV